MKDILQGLAMFDPKERAAYQQQQNLADIGNIMAGQQIPEFLRPGNTPESYSPDQFQQEKINQLWAKGTPEASNLASKFLETPETQINRGNLAARNAELIQRDILATQNRAADAQNNQLRQNELALQKEAAAEEKHIANIKRYTEKLSSRVEKTGATDLLTSFQNLKALVPEEKDIPGYGATYALPDFLISNKGQEIRQQVSTLQNVILKARSGGAISSNEAERLLKELGMGYFKNDAALRRGIKNSEAILKTSLKNVYAGFDQEVLDEYKSRGGITLDDFDALPPLQNKPAIPTNNTAIDKTKFYQKNGEWFQKAN